MPRSFPCRKIRKGQQRKKIDREQVIRAIHVERKKDACKSYSRCGHGIQHGVRLVFASQHAVRAP